MATVLSPVMARRYNYNGRNSPTATVLMKSDNPWERKSYLTNARLAGGALPGMSGLGDDAAPTTDLSATGMQALQAAIAGGTQLAQNRVTTLYGAGAGNLVGQAANALPIVNPQKQSFLVAHPVESSAIGIGAIAVIVGLFMVLRK